MRWTFLAAVASKGTLKEAWEACWRRCQETELDRWRSDLHKYQLMIFRIIWTVLQRHDWRLGFKHNSSLIMAIFAIRTALLLTFFVPLAAQKNVILFIADDLSLRPIFQTPNIQRLRAKGVTFTHAYAQVAKVRYFQQMCCRWRILVFAIAVIISFWQAARRASSWLLALPQAMKFL